MIKIIIRIAVQRPYLSINSPIKSHSDRQNQETGPNYILLIRNPLISKDTHRPKVKGQNHIFHTNGTKNSHKAIILSNKSIFSIKTKKIIKQKQTRKVIIKLKKGSIQQGVITFANRCAPNIRAKCIKQILIDLKKVIDSDTIIVGNFNIQLSEWIYHLERKSKKKQQS